ncbi:DUF4839 domain-containing protein [Arthrobacter sp. S13_S34]|nr:DUF4839 domain-containing protein [Arthrobacter sp. S13_S34]
MSDDIKYEYKSVQAVRGLENRSTAKAQKEGGWELFDQTQGTLRTTLKFRRVKPETFLSKAWSMFRGLAPAKQRVVVAGMAFVLLLVTVGIGTSAAQEKGGSKSTESATVNGVSTPSPTPTFADVTGQVATPGNSTIKSSASAPLNGKSVPSPTPTLAEETDQVITAENNKDFASLLAATDYCAPSMEQFAAEYKGRKIEFDGSIVNLQHHANYDTRYDILVGPGDEGPKTTAGPAFKYDNVNMFDLKFTGKSVPSYVSEGDRFRFIAEVGEYKPIQGCLFFLTPVATTVR